eukprot:CAMPEP_0180220902 /NCGR_PEP_ID=MMETSP0987-20121128/19503_1 /TAXON_ID=697907 /ORGANISM="non described non described, Strain CCMP2293" /LENGTH=97 /DNA_ID=CAMNT_0022182111 /DNA_START=407 /DNA_END=698 /DNA_ORIENTATION=+
MTPSQRPTNAPPRQGESRDGESFFSQAVLVGRDEVYAVGLPVLHDALVPFPLGVRARAADLLPREPSQLLAFIVEGDRGEFRSGGRCAHLSERAEKS